MKINYLAYKTIALTSLTFLFSSPAFANMFSTFENAGQRMGMYTLDCPHWYVGGNIGVSHLHDDPAPGSNDSVDQNGPGWSVDGGYQFNSLLGAELGYTQYHDSRETSGSTNVAKTEHYAVDLAATGHYPLVDKLSALGKLGVAYSYANKIFTASGIAASSGAVSLYGGLGLDYSLTRTVDVIAQWAGVRGNDYTGSSELYSLGVQFSIA